MLSLSGEDKVVVRMSTGPPPVDNMAHQKLLRRVVKKLGLQVEEVWESEDPMVGILAPEGPSRVVQTLKKTIQDTVANTSLYSPMAKGLERKYFAHSIGQECLFTHPPPRLLVATANNKERQGQQRLTPRSKN